MYVLVLYTDTDTHGPAHYHFYLHMPHDIPGNDKLKLMCGETIHVHNSHTKL